MKILKLPKNKGELIFINLPDKLVLPDPKKLIHTDNYKIIGIYNILSDKTYEDYIEKLYFNVESKKRKVWGYMNYLPTAIPDRLALCCSTVKESFNSLMLKQGINTWHNYLIIQENNQK